MKGVLPWRGSQEGPKPKGHPVKNCPGGTVREGGEVPVRCQGTEEGCSRVSYIQCREERDRCSLESATENQRQFQCAGNEA